jgi:cell division protein FtsZ
MVNSKGAKIKVIGVGDCGSNTVTHLLDKKLEHVSLIACNTDVQSLSDCLVPDKLFLGINSSFSEGAQNDIVNGRAAAIESSEAINALLTDNTDILFIVVGLGGGTGAGAAPVVAELAKKLGILTIAFCILPFTFEGEKKAKNAQVSLQKLGSLTDAQLVLSNDKLRESNGSHTTQEAFAEMNELISNTIKCITDISTINAEVNVDLEDIRDVLGNSRTALIGTAINSGENRGMLAAKQANSFPLMLRNNIKGASKILISIMSGPDYELEMDELVDITSYIQNQAGMEAELIFGHAVDNKLKNNVKVTFIASGFSNN